ncbi:MAG: polysaccharide deacetylase family protein [Acidimicrobiia bacterium]
MPTDARTPNALEHVPTRVELFDGERIDAGATSETSALDVIADPQESAGVTRRAWTMLLALVVIGSIAVVVVTLTVPDRKATRTAAAGAATRGEQSPMVGDDNIATTISGSGPTTASESGLATAVAPSTTVKLPGGSAAPVVSRVPTTDKVIFLGIDDGMVRDPAVLEFFRTNKIPFTVFLTKNFASVGEGFWKDAVAAGGVIEGHTATHPDLRKLSWNQLNNEICKVADAYGKQFGARPTLFRPPYGLYDDRVRATAASCGMKAIVMWKGATNDGRLDLAENVLKPGDILLMHWRSDLLDNLKVVVERCKEQGFAIARLQSYIG